MENKYLSNWITQLKKSLVPYLVLKHLSREPKYGYDLLRLINNSLEFGITDGTLYPMLIKMHAEGLLKCEWVEQPSGIPRKYYAITEKAKETIIEMQKHISDLSCIEL